jgi:hypothetical protein
LASSAAKRVVVYRFDRQPIEGFANPSAFLQGGGVELLLMGGTVQAIPSAELKGVCLVGEPVRSFDLFEANQFFDRRPRLSGLWARFTLKDGDMIEGILPHNLVEWPLAGYFFTPPRASNLRQRVYIPRDALAKTELQGVIGAAKAKPRSQKPLPAGQLQMFD